MVLSQGGKRICLFFSMDRVKLKNLVSINWYNIETNSKAERTEC